MIEFIRKDDPSKVVKAKKLTKSGQGRSLDGVHYTFQEGDFIVLDECDTYVVKDKVFKEMYEEKDLTKSESCDIVFIDN